MTQYIVGMVVGAALASHLWLFVIGPLVWRRR